jgi:hypothetical protein
MHGDKLLEGSPLISGAKVTWSEFQGFVSSALASIANQSSGER